jgi:hypothetical protein
MLTILRAGARVWPAGGSILKGPPVNTVSFQVMKQVNHPMVTSLHSMGNLVVGMFAICPLNRYAGSFGNIIYLFHSLMSAFPFDNFPVFVLKRILFLLEQFQFCLSEKVALFNAVNRNGAGEFEVIAHVHLVLDVELILLLSHDDVNCCTACKNAGIGKPEG